MHRVGRRRQVRAAEGSARPNDHRPNAGTLPWDLNYRGPVTFLRQAAARGAPTAGGWDYFVAGWAGALSAIADVPFTGDLLTRFERAAAPFKPHPTTTRQTEKR